MRILYISHRVPYPPNKGDKLRSFNEIKFLSRSHEISLVCLTDKASDIEHKPELESYCRSVEIVYKSRWASRLNAILSAFRSRPFTVGYFASKQMMATVTKMLADDSFDLVFVYCSSMAQYVEGVEAVPKVIDFVDIDSEKWVQYARETHAIRRHIFTVEAKRLRRYERLLCDSFQHCFLASAKELQDFREIVASAGHVSALLNGVDTGTFQPRGHPYDARRIVFTGVMDYFANIQTVLYFAGEILPLIKRKVPGVQFYVVGTNPVKEVLRLSAADPCITVTGHVKEIQPYLREAAVFVAPMRIARGVQNKILEAMAMGVPVVTNQLGLQGISATAGVDIVVADTPAEFARQVVRLMTDPEWREEVSRNSQKTVAENYNWDKNLIMLNEILAGVTTQIGRPPKVPAGTLPAPARLRPRAEKGLLG